MLRTIFYCVCFFHFVSYSIQALFTQRGRLPSTSLSLRGLTYAEVRVIQVLASRVLKKHEYETLHTQTTSYTLILYVDFSALLFVFFFFFRNFGVALRRSKTMARGGAAQFLALRQKNRKVENLHKEFVKQ